MSNLQKWGEWDIETAAAEREEFDKASGNAEFWKVPEGRTLVRFLPPRPGKGSIFRFVWQHYFDAMSGGPGPKRQRLVCPLNQAKNDKLQPRFCPVCAHADQLRSSGNEEDFRLAGEFISQRKVFALILVRPEEERGVRVWEFGKKIYEKLDSIRRDENAGGNFAHPVNGFDLVVQRQGQGLKTEYDVFPARKMSALLDDASSMEALLESMPDLDRHARVPSEGEVPKLWGQAALGGGSHNAPARGAAPRGGYKPKAGVRMRTAADAIDVEGEGVDFE